MNQRYGTILAAVFILAIGIFNIAIGISSIRRRSKSTFWGIVRFVFGILLLLAPVGVYVYFSSSGGF